MNERNKHSLNNALTNKQSKDKANKEITFNDFVESWKNKFTNKIEKAVNSRKEVFTLKDAIDKSITKNRRSELDKVMIIYLKYINKNPLNDNDYFKYFNSYINGKRLDDKYFKHDLSVLHEYYDNYDEKDDEAKSKYIKFSTPVWERYVLFMLLKFNNLYKSDELKDFNLNQIFKVQIKGNREYNPLTNVARVLRGMIPKELEIIEYDIARANPTFIDIELNIDRKEDIYSVIDKEKFVTLTNINKESKNANIEEVRRQLEPVYGNRVDEVITEDRFNNKGRMYEDLSEYEKKYINRFVKANNVKTFVRLHDAIFVSAQTEIKETVFDKVCFKKSKVKPPEVINKNKLFYSFDDKNQVETSPVSYKDFFEQENLIRVSIKDDDSITIFKDSNNVVKRFNHKTDTVSFLKSKINEYDSKPVENKIAKDNNKDIKDSFCLLDPVPLVYYRDDANSFGLPFKNGFVLLKKGSDKVEIKRYNEVNGFFAEHPIQGREFKFIKDPKPSIFERFMTLVSTKKDPSEEELTEHEQKTQSQFFRMFGYLLHTYKDPSFCPSIILSDMDADDVNRNGRRGKSLIGEATKQVQNIILKGGNEFDGAYRHRFADLEEGHKIYIIDDVPASFNYNDLYTNIVGGISVEPKGKKSRNIDHKQTPKFLITTNWAVRYDENASSTNARFMEFKFTDFFNVNHKPIDYFEHRFFEDWNAEQWNQFYNFCFRCVAKYIEFGLEAPVYNKDVDNFRAYFYNDTLLNEFERIFEIVRYDDGFNVSEFLRHYQSSGNSLRYERFFTSRNTKNLIDVYLKHNKIEHKFREDQKKWFIDVDSPY